MTQKNRPGQAIAERVIRAREEAGLSKTELAEKMGLSKQGYNHYENFTTPFTVEQLLTLARILGRSVEWFLGLDTGLSEDEDRALTLYREARAAGMGPVAIAVLEGVVLR